MIEKYKSFNPPSYEDIAFIGLEHPRYGEMPHKDRKEMKYRREIQNEKPTARYNENYSRRNCNSFDVAFEL